MTLVLTLAFALPAGSAGPPSASSAGDGPLRVATLVPFAGDAVARVPGRARLVASVRRGVTEPPPASVIDLGSPHAPSFERLAESGAQLVVADAAMHATLTEKLGRGGAEVLLIDSGSVDATFAGLRELGRRVGAAAEMDRAVDEASAGITAAALERPVATLPIFGAPGSFLVITDRTWLGDLLGKLNFQNLAASSAGKESVPGYVQVSDEVLAGMHPALVLLVAHGDPQTIRTAFLRRADADGAWRSFGQAEYGVHVLDGNVFGANPGLGLPAAAARLRGLVVPGATASRASGAGGAVAP